MASDIPLKKTLIALFEGDVETLKQFYPKPVGYNFAIRHIVHEHVLRLREQESREGVKQDVRTSEAIAEFVASVASVGADG